MAQAHSISRVLLRLLKSDFHLELLFSKLCELNRELGGGGIQEFSPTTAAETVN